MIRSAAAVLSLVPLVFILSGCGGGDSGSSGEKCTNEKMKLVSQSVEMAGNFEFTKIINATDSMKMQVPVTICEKLDMEFMKWFVDYRVDMPELNPFMPSNPFPQENVEVKMMLDVPTKKAAFALNIPIPDGQKMSNCTYVSIPWLGAPEAVAKCVKDGIEKEGMAPTMVPGLAIEGPVCKKNTDGLDEWTIKFQNETMVAPGKYEMLSVTESYKVDANSLFRGFSMDVKVGTMATMYGSMETKETPKSVGASDADVDYTKWGFDKCVEMPMGGGGGPPPQLQQMLMALSSKPGASSIVPLMLQHKDTIQGRRLQGGMPGGVPMPPGGLPAWAQCFMPSLTTPPPAEVSMVV